MAKLACGLCCDEHGVDLIVQEFGVVGHGVGIVKSVSRPLGERSDRTTSVVI